MKTTIFLTIFLAFSGSISAQNQSETDNKPINQNWSQLGHGTEGSRGFTLFTRGIRAAADGRFQLWLKVVPNNVNAFAKRYDIPKDSAYIVQFATIDCSVRSVDFEKASAYNNQDALIPSPSFSLSSTVRRNSVKRGSIAEETFRFVCVEPSVKKTPQAPALSPQP